MNNKKFIAAIAAGALALGCTIGGTVAWLTANSGTVTNTFTVGDINIKLDESGVDANGTKNFDFVPGDTLAKDPYVVVEAKSEACWVFVEVTETNNTITGLTGDAINWAVRSDWTPVTGTNIWYKEVAATGTTDTDPMYILTGSETNVNGQVTVNPEITKGMVQTINADDTKPTLSFAAFAHQSDNTTIGVAIQAAKDYFAAN